MDSSVIGLLLKQRVTTEMEILQLLIWFWGLECRILAKMELLTIQKIRNTCPLFEETTTKNLHKYDIFLYIIPRKKASGEKTTVEFQYMLMDEQKDTHHVILAEKPNLHGGHRSIFCFGFNSLKVVGSLAAI